jgi:hypothetical protein
VAAGAEPNLATLYQATGNNIGASSLCVLESSVGDEMVSVFALDDLILPLGIAPTLVKVDVEGLEFEALRGLERTLRRYRPAVLCELTAEWVRGRGADPNDLLAFMAGLDYEAYVIGDGPLFAQRRLSRIASNAPSFKEEICFRCAT